MQSQSFSRILMNYGNNYNKLKTNKPQIMR